MTASTEQPREIFAPSAGADQRPPEHKHLCRGRIDTRDGDGFFIVVHEIDHRLRSPAGFNETSQLVRQTRAIIAVHFYPRGAAVDAESFSLAGIGIPLVWRFLRDGHEETHRKEGAEIRFLLSTRRDTTQLLSAQKCLEDV